MSLPADHIREKSRALARLNGITGAVLRDLALFFATLTAHGEWQGSESSFRDLGSARKARAVPARLEPDERFADPGQRRRSHLEQHELDVPVDVGVRRVDVIADVVAQLEPFMDPILDVILQFTPAFDEYLPQVGMSSGGVHDY
jgi:hypothetical protein